MLEEEDQEELIPKSDNERVGEGDELGHCRETELQGEDADAEEDTETEGEGDRELLLPRDSGKRKEAQVKAIPLPDSGQKDK